jgi:hypothetical protein
MYSVRSRYFPNTNLECYRCYNLRMQLSPSAEVQITFIVTSLISVQIKPVKLLLFRCDDGISGQICGALLRTDISIFFLDK